MRGVLFLGASLALLVTTACVTEAAPDRSDRGGPASRSIAGADRITIREQSNVCVSVQVDQAVWPVPLTAEAHWSFGGVLASEMRRLYERRGGSTVLPLPSHESRFTSDYNGLDPRCRDPEDIHVIVHYSARPDGTPFNFAYRIEQGSAVRSGASSRDIEEEWRRGALRRSAHSLPLADAVTEDLRARAGPIMDQLN